MATGTDTTDAAALGLYNKLKGYKSGNKWFSSIDPKNRANTEMIDSGEEAITAYKYLHGLLINAGISLQRRGQWKRGEYYWELARDAWNAGEKLIKKTSSSSKMIPIKLSCGLEVAGDDIVSIMAQQVELDKTTTAVYNDEDNRRTAWLVTGLVLGMIVVTVGAIILTGGVAGVPLLGLGVTASLIAGGSALAVGVASLVSTVWGLLRGKGKWIATSQSTPKRDTIEKPEASQQQQRTENTLLSDKYRCYKSDQYLKALINEHVVPSVIPPSTPGFSTPGADNVPVKVIKMGDYVKM